MHLNVSEYWLQLEKKRSSLVQSCWIHTAYGHVKKTSAWF